jgi:glycosyltransferase involved in cell wall biosynthesis
MRDLVFVSMENWDDIWRRNQFLCAEFTRRFPDLRILFVGLPRDVSHAIRKHRFNDLRSPHPIHPPGFPNITLCRPLKFLPTTFALGRWTNDLVVRLTIKHWMRRLHLENPILWLNPHYAVHMVGRMGESKVIYDITDDWTELTQTPKMKNLTIRQDRELCRKADQVIVCSQRLFDIKRTLTKNLHLIPNGVDAEHYLSVTDKHAILPAVATEWSRPILGYTGTVHPDRVDVNLVERLARKLSPGSVVLLGPNMLPEAQRRQLLACGNVFFHPAVPYQQIPEYMRAFDVCITPHKVTPFTAGLNPIKLWEYLAAGKPIISTPVAGFTDFPQHIYLASDAQSFLDQLWNALTEPASRIAARRAAVAQHSWSARVEQIAALLEPQPAQPSPREVVPV